MVKSEVLIQKYAQKEVSLEIYFQIVELLLKIKVPGMEIGDRVQYQSAFELLFKCENFNKNCKLKLLY